MNNTHNASCGFLKMNLAKFPAISMENDQQTSFFFASDEPEDHTYEGKGKQNQKKRGERKEEKSEKQKFRSQFKSYWLLYFFFEQKKTA